MGIIKLQPDHGGTGNGGDLVLRVTSDTGFYGAPWWCWERRTGWVLGMGKNVKREMKREVAMVEKVRLKR